ncbi:MAG: class I SAM-dependent methyltransferase [Leptospirales bacterium]|nr:class I SAM-dependent methyltransferase [Leptospirales bacterium]
MTVSKITARNADRHMLYQEAVQNVEFEAGMIARIYRKLRGKDAQSLKEDFCGTFALACEWIRRGKMRSAVGVDLDGSVLQWGRKHNLSALNASQQERLQIVKANVLDVRQPQVDIVGAFNFSYWIFKTRAELSAYYVNCLKSLKRDGILVLDAFGGARAHTEQEEPRRCSGFTYVWEHAHFSPVTHDMECRIHFKFRDGTMMRNAFKYSWRLWSPAEITELLLEAGFKEVRHYFEGTDHKTGEGNGVFRETSAGESAECWIAYIVALR